MRIIPHSPVLHDGKALKEGEVVELPDDQAEALVAAGVAEEAPEDGKTETAAQRRKREKAEAEAAAKAADEAAQAEAAKGAEG